MEIRYFDIEGVFELVPRVFTDSRGQFLETYNRTSLLEQGIDLTFVQDNQSFSYRNVLRGLHFQYPPYEQGKLVRVISGKAFDVAVDIRPGSETYGRYVSCTLDGTISNMIYIPPGFAHGFVALTDVILFYKCTETYHREAESGIAWNDPDLNIDWGIRNPVVSEKDIELPGFKALGDKFAKGNQSGKYF